MDLVSLSAVVLLVVTAVVALAAAAYAPFFRLALRFFLERKRLTALAVLGLMVASSMVTGSLAVGDSMRYGVVEGVYGNLGAVDEAVVSNGLFNESVLDALVNDGTLGGMTDAMAPLLVLKGAVQNGATRALESKASILGYDSRFLAMGGFEGAGGSIPGGVPGRGEAVINERLAGEIGARTGDVVKITLRNPEFSIESIFSPLAQQVTANVSVIAVVRDAGLGRFTLESGGKVLPNAFLSLGYLQEIVRAPSRLNTIAVSNLGGDRDGVGLTGDVTTRLQAMLDEAVGFRDLKFHVDAFGYVRVDNDNVFFDERYLDTIASFAGQVPGIEAVSPLVSYFVNNISFRGRSVAYSTVTGLDPVTDAAFDLFTLNPSGLPAIGEIGDDEIIITNYTAGRTGAGVGDTITLNYTVYDSKFSQVYREASFSVRYVVNITGKADDPNLMPPFPGIRGKASCGDWDPPWISGDRMRSEMVPADLDYWLAYGGTPKAYITLRRAQALWSNDLGNLTTIKVKAGAPVAVANDIASMLNASVVAGDAGIQVLPVKASGLQSAEGVQLLTETFLAFGVVVIVSGIILTVVLVGMIMEGRKAEIGVLKTLGATRRQVTGTFAFEAFLLAAPSSAVGVLAGLLIALVCVALTNVFWSNTVEGTTVQLHFTPETLVIGYTAGFLISFLTFAVSAHWISGSVLSRLLRGTETEEGPKRKSYVAPSLAVVGVAAIAAYLVVPMEESARLLAGLAGPVVLALSLPFLSRKGRLRDIAVRACALAAIAYTFAYDAASVSLSESTPFLLFFASGFAIVLACVVGLWSSMRPLASGLSRLLGAFGPRLGVYRVSFLSPSRRARRTCLAVSLFAVVIFTYLGLSVNVQGQQLNLNDIVAHQGAGYDVFAETSIPLRFDLGSETERARNGITGFPQGAETVQFLSFGQIGGSCSNLRRNLPPRLIGANGTFVRESQLRFQTPADASGSAWSWLDGPGAGGAIPAIGDYNTVVWILGRNVGDFIQVVDERGQERQLVVVAITENSIFPGSLFVSEANLNELYPTGAEYALFLFRTADSPGLVSYLESSLEPYGMDAVPVDELVRGNLSVEWSYIGLFQTLLLLGLFVGMLGMAASTSRAVEERKSEIGTVRAIGFGRSTVLTTLIVENLYVAALGAAVGVVAGLLTAYAFFGRGSLLGYGVAVPWVAMFAVVVALCAISILATIGPARRAARMNPVEALRRE